MKLNRIISSVLAFAMAISIVPVASFAAETVHSTIYSDDFESYDVSAYPKPKPDGLTITGDSDCVYVDTVGTSKRLWLKNDGFVKALEVGKSFRAISGKTVTFELDFLQLYNKSEGDTVLGIYSGTAPALLIKTSGENIVYSSQASGVAHTNDVVIVNNYTANKEYTFKVVVDLFNNEAQIYVEDEFVYTGMLLNTTGTIDNFKIASKQLPGFCVDDINIYMEEGIDTVLITGDTNLVIPAYDSTEYQFTAAVYDANGSVTNDVELEWTLQGAPSGVSIVNPVGKTIKLSVDKTAGTGFFTLKAKVKDSEISGTLNVSTEPLQATSVEVVGWEDKVEILDKKGNKSYITYPSYRITAEDREAKTYKFTAKVLDQFGNEVENYGDFSWEIVGECPDYVSVNENTGVITVKKNPTAEQFIELKAIPKDNPNIRCEPAKVSVLDFDTYAMDKIRFDSVIEHIETSLEAASLEGTPLLSDIFLRGDEKPVRIPESLKDAIESNVMSQSNLMRSMYNLSEITGNDKYKNRVDEIYKLMMRDGLMSNGVMMSWGGHMTMDMEVNKPFGTYNSGTHEIKGISPFVAPMFSQTANGEYDDAYNNGYGLAGFLFRAMISGHAMGNYETLEFERHWNGGHATAFEPVWQTPEVFDEERRGPAQRSGGAPFNSCAANIIDILVTYYNTTGDEYGLSWAANFMDTILNSAFTYYVYKDSEGNYIWPSDTTNMKYYSTEAGAFGEEPKRKFLDKDSNLRYVSVKSDIQPMTDSTATASYIYEHRDVAELDAEGNITNTVKVIDVATGEEKELTLVLQNCNLCNGCADGDDNTACENPQDGWNNGSWGEMATMIGDHYKLDAVSENLGYIWYLHSGYKETYGGTGYGDRLYNQIVTGTLDPADKDTWVEQGRISEEEASLMLDPYSRMRGIQTNAEILYAMCETIEALSEAGREDEAIEYLEKCSKGAYNDLKQTYSFSTDTYWAYMTWIRPEYMRSNEIASYKDSYAKVMETAGSEERAFWEKYGELPWNVEIPSGSLNDHDKSLKNQMYFRGEKALARTVHRGYYGDPGEVTFGEKRVEPVHMGSYIVLCGTLRDAIEKLERTPATDPNYTSNMAKAELFRNRVKYIWKVLRDMFSEKAPIGDIGEDFFNLDPNLDFATSSNNYEMVEMMISAYKATGHKDFLKFARAIANNWMRSNYASHEQMFTNGSNYFGTVSNDMLQILIELDALLLDRFDENIPYTSLVRGNEFYDTYVYHNDGRYSQETSFVDTPSILYPNDSVKVQEVNILHDTIELKVGQSIKIQYEVIPWDAGSKAVLWDIYDQRVAMMDTDTATLYGLKKGKTKIRCVASSRTGIESKEVEVIVK